MKSIKILIAAAAALSFANVPAHADYVAATWGDNRVHILDDSFNDISSFAVGQTNPNGIGTDGSTIWVGTFNDSTVRAFDYSGNLLFSWGGSGFSNLQGLDYMNGVIAIANGSQIQYRNPLTGALISTITGPNITSTIEGLDFDGTLIWAIADQNLYGLDPVTGNTISTIPNAAVGCSFSGTGNASINASQMALACSDGSWFVVNSGTGAVITSGNNGLQMFGLDRVLAVPEPGILSLLGLGLGFLGMRRARR